MFFSSFYIYYYYSIFYMLIRAAKIVSFFYQTKFFGLLGFRKSLISIKPCFVPALYVPHQNIPPL
ncbi:MAG TPA: hypothetical protein DDZ04_07660 [Parabacteroides sp.]|nr:hypothetical protein [Parabacteroides sp.]